MRFVCLKWSLPTHYCYISNNLKYETLPWQIFQSEKIDENFVMTIHKLAPIYSTEDISNRFNITKLETLSLLGEAKAMSSEQVTLILVTSSSAKI